MNVDQYMAYVTGPQECDACGGTFPAHKGTEVCSGGVPVLWFCSDCYTKQQMRNPVQRALTVACECCHVKELCAHSRDGMILLEMEGYEDIPYLDKMKNVDYSKWKKLPDDEGSGNAACAVISAFGKSNLAWDSWCTGDDWGYELAMNWPPKPNTKHVGEPEPPDWHDADDDRDTGECVDDEIPF